jgi:hypothetical protein
MKTATILDQDRDDFGLEYDNTRGGKNTMRLDASTYERAIEEARRFLGIQSDDHDEEGNLWAVE